MSQRRSSGGSSQWVIASGKTFTANNTLTLAGTDGTTFTFPSLGGNLVSQITNQAFVFDGDSLTADDPVNHVDWPAQCMLLSQFIGLGTKYNYAVTGDNLSDLQARYTSSVYPHRPSAAGTQRSMFFVWVGANDYNTSDPSTWVTNWESYISTAVSDGFTVVVFTIMQRNGVGWSDWETSRQTMNTGIRAYAAANNLLLIDVDAMFPDPNNLDYFKTDKTHLIPAANVLLAGTINNLVSGQGRALGYTGNLLKLDNTFWGKNTFYNGDSTGVEPVKIQQNNGGYICTFYYNGSKVADVHPDGIYEAISGFATIGGGGSAGTPIFRDFNSSGLYFSATNHVSLSAGGTQVLDATSTAITLSALLLKLTPISTPGSHTANTLFVDSGTGKIYFDDGSTFNPLY